MISEKIVFQDSLWTKLVWILSRPNEWYDMPIVIACHGFWSTKENTTNFELSKLITDKWIAYFCYDSFAHWESTWNFVDMTISKSIDWIKSAIEFIKSIWFNRLWLFWSSFGWHTILNYIWQHSNNIICVATKSLPSDYYERKEEQMRWELMEKYISKWYRIYSARWRDNKVSYDFHTDAKKHSLYVHWLNIQCPTLLLHSIDDKDVPYCQSTKLFKIIPECELITFKWVWHNLKSQDWEINKNPEANEYFVNFFKKYLLE